MFVRMPCGVDVCVDELTIGDLQLVFARNTGVILAHSLLSIALSCILGVKWSDLGCCE